MSLVFTLRKCLDRLIMRARARAKRHSRIVLVLEELENRLVPTIFSVTVGTDSAAGMQTGPNAGDLRYCIGQANLPGGTGTDTITFVPSVTAVMLTQGTLNITDPRMLTIRGLPHTSATSNRSTYSAISGNGSSTLFQVNGGSNVTFDHVEINGGRGTLGGGINNAGNLTVTYCTLEGNTARQGGAVYNSAMATLSNCTFSNNFAQGATGIGGCIANFGTVRVTNCTFAANSADSFGGAIFASGLTTVTNCTIDDNYAVSGGGGIHVQSGTLNLANTIVTRNLASHGPEIFNNGGTIGIDTHNLIGNGDMSGLVDGHNGDQVGNAANPINPRLLPLADNGGPTWTEAFFSLRSLRSPAIDAGSNAAAVDAMNIPITTDQRGAPFARIAPAQGTVDIGAFEQNPRDILVALAKNFAFYVDSRGLFEGTIGTEKWLRSDVFAGTPWYFKLPDGAFYSTPWYFILPDGSFYSWDGSNGLTGTFLLNAGPNAYENPELIVNASGLVAANPTEVQSADQARAFYRASGGNFCANSFRNEKWIKGKISAKAVPNQNNPWYFILPDGSVHEWDGQAGKLTGTLVAEITPDPNLALDPSLLTDAFQDPGVTSGGFASQRHFFIDRSQGFVRNLFENTKNADEKWFRGDVNQFANPWYFILPNGDLFEWDRSATATGHMLAHLGPNAWNNLERVVNDFSPVLPGPSQQQVVLLDARYGLFRASNDGDFFFNALGQQEKWLRGTTNAFGNPWYLLLPGGSLVSWDGTSTPSGQVVATNLPADVYADPLLLADAFADGAVLNNSLKLDPFAPNGGGPGDRL